MFGLLKSLSDWTLGFADSGWSTLALAVDSFTESIFFPIPPDLLLIAIGIRRPEMALWLAGLATVSSVAGALVGHWLGGRFGRPLLYRLVPQRKIEPVERLFRKYGAWAVLMAAFTPIPYKVFAISAGILNLDRRTFILASLVGRGARFLALGALLYAYGDSVEEFIDDRFEPIVVATSVAMVVGLGIAAILVKRRQAKGAAE